MIHLFGSYPSLNVNGSQGRIRTRDPNINSILLYRLSYKTINKFWSPHRGSNPILWIESPRF